MRHLCIDAPVDPTQAGTNSAAQSPARAGVENLSNNDLRREQELEALKHEKGRSMKKQQKSKKKTTGDVFFEDAMDGAGESLDRPPEITGGKQKERSQQFERCRLLMIELSDSVHNEIYEAIEKNANANPYAAYIKGVSEEMRKNQKLQIELSTKIASLERNCCKTNNFMKSKAAAKLDATVDVATEQDLFELGRRAEFFRGSSKPAQLKHAGAWSRSNTADVNDRAKCHAVKESKASTLGEKFLQIERCDYRELYKFFFYNPRILESEEHISYIQNEASQAIRNGAEAFSQRCLHHWDVLRLCRALGVNVFFQRMIVPPSPASKCFYDELDDMYEGSKRPLPKPEDDSWPEDWSPYYVPGHEPGRSHVWCFDQETR